jgi:hypothetical protein
VKASLYSKYLGRPHTARIAANLEQVVRITLEKTPQVRRTEARAPWLVNAPSTIWIMPDIAAHPHYNSKFRADDGYRQKTLRCHIAASRTSGAFYGHT